jgi:hypothetical protein
MNEFACGGDEMTTPSRVSWTNVDTGTPEPVAVTASNNTNQAL